MLVAVVLSAAAATVEGEEETSLVEGWRERVTEAGEVAAKQEVVEEAVAAADRSHVHGARNGASRTTRSAITQVAPRTMLQRDVTWTRERDVGARRVIDCASRFRFWFSACRTDELTRELSFSLEY